MAHNQVKGDIAGPDEGSLPAPIFLKDTDFVDDVSVAIPADLFVHA